MAGRHQETVSEMLRNRHLDEEHRFNDSYVSMHVYHGLGQHCAELHRARERSIEPYRTLYEEYRRSLDLDAADPRERSFARRCSASARSSFARWLHVVADDIDSAIEELMLALADLNGIEANQARHGLYNSFGHYFSLRAIWQDSEYARDEDLKRAAKYHAQALNYVKNNPTADVYHTIAQIAGVLEQSPATAARSLVLWNILADMRPTFSHLQKRAKLMREEGLTEELRGETAIGSEHSLEDIAKAVAACAALRRYKRARELAQQGSRLAQASGENRWLQVFDAYLGIK